MFLPVPMLDLKKELAAIKEEMVREVSEVIESGQYILGQKVARFEELSAAWLGVRHAIGVASGTDALLLPLKALGVGPGDEVITTPFTFFATAEVIIYLGARPVFADIDPETFNIDPAKVEEKITGRTKALLPVHLFGHPARMDLIMEMARRHGLEVVEDCAQSFGTSLGGKKTGSFGDAGAFSFYPSKNLGAYGDGGLVATDSDETAARIRLLRNHGLAGRYIHESIGFNSRLDEIQAAVLLVKLKRVGEQNAKRRLKAALYDKFFSAAGVKCPPSGADVSALPVYHQYTIRHPHRDAVMERLRAEGVSSMVYYPVPLHLQPAMRFMGYKEGDFPCAEAASREVLSLPIYPELEDETIERITKIVRGA